MELLPVEFVPYCSVQHLASRATGLFVCRKTTRHMFRLVDYKANPMKLRLCTAPGYLAQLSSWRLRDLGNRMCALSLQKGSRHAVEVAQMAETGMMRQIRF